MELSEIVEAVDTNGSRHVCVTGGEPLLQKEVFPLMETLSAKGYIVSLETSGSLTIEKVPEAVHTILDIKCPGSGMEEKNYWPNIGLLKPIDEVKFVLLDRTDYEYACNIIKKYRLDSKVNALLLSPVHGVLDPQVLVDWILADKLPVRLNLQVHKTIWTPQTRGV